MRPPKSNVSQLLDPAQVHSKDVSPGKDALVFPGEKPDAVTFKVWQEQAAKHANSKGWMALVRGKTPPALIQNMQKDLSLVPVGSYKGTGL